MRHDPSDGPRLLVVDPTCAGSGGHFWPTVHKFAVYFAAQPGWSADAMVCSELCTPEADFQAMRVLRFVYAWHFLPDQPTLRQRIERKSTFVLARQRFGMPLLRRFAFRYWLHPWALRGASANVARMLGQLALAGRRTVLFFPGADFYSVIALASALRSWKCNSENVSVVLRFIDVFDIKSFREPAEPGLVAAVRNIANLLGDRLGLACETQSQATRLSNLFELPVHVTGIPVPAVASSKPQRVI